METRPPDHLPPSPPFAVSCDLDPSCEIDVELDLGDEDELEAAALARATDPEGVEFLGEYPTIQAYLRAQLEPEIAVGVNWILDMVDWREVQERFEADGGRLVCEHGQVYRVGG